MIGKSLGMLGLVAVISVGSLLASGVGAQDATRLASEIVPSTVLVLGGMTCETDPAPDGDPMGIPIADTCEASIPASGTIVTPEKLILTSATVALNEDRDEPVWTVVFLTVDVRKPPVAAFFARPVIYDERIDLALLQPKWTLAGDPIEESDLASLVALPISGEEAAVQVEDRIRLIGYPFDVGNAKETISVLPADVAGFLPDEDNPELEGAGFIKADSSVGQGMNGGTVVDNAGVLVGVPASSRGGNVQCQDVDGDGEIDQARECIVRGGEISLLRPVPEGLNLLYERAEAAGQLGGDEPTETPVATVEPSDPGQLGTPTPDEPRRIPFPRRGGVPTDAPAETAAIIGTFLSADTGEPIAGAYFLVLQPGVTVREFVDAEADSALIYSLGISNGRGQFQLGDRADRGERYSTIGLAEGYEPIADDDVLLADDDDPATVDLGELELSARD
jgi:hypothetical protein